MDIGFKSEGLVQAWEFMEEDGTMTIKVGDTVDVLVEDAEDEDGRIVLSKEKAERLKIWDEISGAFDDDRAVEGTVIARVKGGLVGRHRCQGIPAGLPGRSSPRAKPRGDDRPAVRIQDHQVQQAARQHRALATSACSRPTRKRLRQDTLETLSASQIVDGVIKNLTDYGAFIDLGGIDGLLHITDMSWGRINHPSETVQGGR